MNVNFEKLNNVSGELTVSLEEKDYAEKVKKQLKEIAKGYSEPGFRPGHVPFGKVEKKYGPSVKYDVVNKEIGDAVYDYIRENKLRVLGQPVPEDTNIFNDEEKEFKFKFKVGIAPEIKNPVNKDLHIPYYTIQVSDAMVDEQIEGLRKRFGRQVSGDETEPDAVIKGVISELNPDGTIKEGGIVVENGILAPIHFTNEEQKKLFEGKHKGDVVVFNPAATCDSNATEMSSMLNIDKNDIENHKGDFNFEITDIIVLKPADFDQEFFDNAVGKDKAHSEEELKAAVRELISLNLENDSNYRFTIDAREAIMKTVGEIELPDDILKDFLIRQNEGITKENVDEEYTKMKPTLQWDLIRDEIASQFDVKVTEEDLLDEAKGLVINRLSQYGSYGLTEQLVEQYAKQYLQEKKNRDMMANNAANRKTFDAIRENVSLDSKQVTVDEFRKLFVSKEG